MAAGAHDCRPIHRRHPCAGLPRLQSASARHDTSRHSTSGRFGAIPGDIGVQQQSPVPADGRIVCGRIVSVLQQRLYHEIMLRIMSSQVLQRCESIDIAGRPFGGHPLHGYADRQRLAQCQRSERISGVLGPVRFERNVLQH